MGQIQQGPPDTANSPAGSAAPSADDLLAQLAGDEIDRMLAEAEQSSSPPVSSNPPAREAMPAASTAAPGHPGVDLTVDSSATALALDALLEATLAESPSPDAQSTPPADIPSAIEAAKEAILDQSPASNSPIVSPAIESHPEESHELPEPPVAAPVVAAARAAPAATRAAAATIDAVEAEPSEPRIPIYIRVLEFLNSPLNALPENVRSAVGPIAIATFIHSVAVIVYVIRFRRR